MMHDPVRWWSMDSGQSPIRNTIYIARYKLSSTDVEEFKGLKRISNASCKRLTSNKQIPLLDCIHFTLILHVPQKEKLMITKYIIPKVSSYWKFESQHVTFLNSHEWSLNIVQALHALKQNLNKSHQNIFCRHCEKFSFVRLHFDTKLLSFQLQNEAHQARLHNNRIQHITIGLEVL